MKSTKTLVISLILTGLVACTIIPSKPNTNREILSGGPKLLDFYTNQVSEVYGILNQEAYLKYLSLIQEFGTNKLILITETNNGVTTFTNNTFLINLNNLRKFETMSGWRKNNIIP